MNNFYKDILVAATFGVVVLFGITTLSKATPTLATQNAVVQLIEETQCKDKDYVLKDAQNNGMELYKSVDFEKLPKFVEALVKNGNLSKEQVVGFLFAYDRIDFFRWGNRVFVVLYDKDGCAKSSFEETGGVEGVDKIFELAFGENT